MWIEFTLRRFKAFEKLKLRSSHSSSQLQRRYHDYGACLQQQLSDNRLALCELFFYFYLTHPPLLHAPWLLPILLYIILLCIQFGDSTTYKFVLYNLSNVMLSVSFLKVLLYLLMRISLLMGHFSVRSTAAFSLFLSCYTTSQSYIVRSIVCSPFCMSTSDCLWFCICISMI